MHWQRDPAAAECDQAGDREQGAGRKSRPGNGADDQGDPEADRQAREREQAEEAGADQRADQQPLQEPGLRPRQLVLVGPEIKGEKGREKREAAWIDDGQASGDQCDRDRNGVDRRPF